MRRLILCLVLWGAAVAPASARPDLCERAALHAARATGVPVDVLLAITLVETGRRIGEQIRPWPWAANSGGHGYWFDTRDEAIQFARDRLTHGQRSIDLGCFQINWRWHGDSFTSFEALLDPEIAAHYAARHLLSLYRSFGSWTAAAGAYHTRTPGPNARYQDRFRAMRAALSPAVPTMGPRASLFAPRAQSGQPFVDLGR